MSKTRHEASSRRAPARNASMVSNTSASKPCTFSSRSTAVSMLASSSRTTIRLEFAILEHFRAKAVTALALTAAHIYSSEHWDALTLDTLLFIVRQRRGLRPNLSPFCGPISTPEHPQPLCNHHKLGQGGDLHLFHYLV